MVLTNVRKGAWPSLGVGVGTPRGSKATGSNLRSQLCHIALRACRPFDFSMP